VDRLKIALVVCIAFLLPACAGMQGPPLQNESLLEADLAQISLATPQPNLFSDDAYHLLVAEIAIMRGQTDLAVQNYLSVARSFCLINFCQNSRTIKDPISIPKVFTIYCKISSYSIWNN